MDSAERTALPGAPDVPPARELLARARTAAAAGDASAAAASLATLATTTRDLPTWMAAARQLSALAPGWERRRVRLAVLGSHTTGHLVPALVTAAAAEGVALEVHEAPYGQYQQEALEPSPELTAFAPDVVLLAVDARELRFPAVSSTPEEDVAAEVARWRGTWDVLRERWGATVLQLGFVAPVDDALGSSALRVPGSRRRQVRALDLALGACAPDGVHLVDAQAVALAVGLHAWSDPRYWFLSKHAVGLGALPALAGATCRVLAAALGLSRKVVAVDLDGTLWGGVVGEDGAAGVVVGDGPAGEAHQALQDHLLALQRRGVLLVAVSKNDDADARAPFLERPEMRLRLEHFAAFRASWDDKPSALRQLAEDLGLGLDSFVFVDDNPVERAAVRRELPQVGVVPLPVDPAGYVPALAAFPGMEAAALTAEDAERTDQYRSRARVAALAAGAGTREEFLAGLHMRLTVEDVSEANAARVVQLVGRTNQFNLTGRRHSAAAVGGLRARPGAVALALRLRDDHTDHGLVGAVLGVPDAGGEALQVDTWVMSCRVLGRGLEPVVMRAVADRARAAGLRRLVGEFVPTDRNTPAARAYADAGFEALERAGGARDDGPELWSLDLAQDGPALGPVVLEDPAS